MKWYFPDLGWIFINIFVPVALPFIGIAAIRLAPSAPSTRLLAQVKDGQLNWIATAMCAVGLYEQSEARHVCQPFNPDIPAYWDYLETSMICSIVMSFLLASSGAVFLTPIRRPNSSGSWIAHYKVFTASLIIMIVSIIEALIVHGASAPGCSIWIKGSK